MSNPVINRLDEYANGGYEIIDEKSIMSVSGTMNAFLVLGVLALIPAMITWNWVGLGYINRAGLMATIGTIAGLILCLIMCFKPKTSPYLAPLYAVSEGMFLGGISAMFQLQSEGIVVQAVAATLVVIFSMFFLYKTGLIRVTEKMRSVVLILTASIAVLYLIGIISSWLGFNAVSSMLWGKSGLSIGISFAICAVAAFNLLLDFDNIEYFSQKRVPSYMNWFCAMGLMVTIVWLYIEILKLFAKRR